MVLVRYFAGARAAAGLAEEKVSASTVDDLSRVLAATHGQRLAKVLAACSYLVDGVACHDRNTTLDDGVTVDVLPPFAGG
jgi:sulfur-carrier protein